QWVSDGFLARRWALLLRGFRYRPERTRPPVAADSENGPRSGIIRAIPESCLPNLGGPRMPDLPDSSRRSALKCLAYGSAGTLFALSGGVFTATDLAFGATSKDSSNVAGTPLFVQISDTHIGFNKDANPDANGTLKRTIDIVNAMPQKPAFILHTGDIT